MAFRHGWLRWLAPGISLLLATNSKMMIGYVILNPWLDHTVRILDMVVSVMYKVHWWHRLLIATLLVVSDNQTRGYSNQPDEVREPVTPKETVYWDDIFRFY